LTGQAASAGAPAVDGRAVAWTVSELGYRSELGRNLRHAGAAMILASYAVPLAPGVGSLCPLRRLTGIPCPFCGLTTGVVATTHGHVAGGLMANPVAPLLVLATLAGWLTWSLRRGRVGPAWSPPPRLWAWARWGVAPVVAGMWVFELARFRLL
jgi:hypothetical protein